MSEILARIPQVQKLLETPDARKLCRQYRREAVADAVRAALDRVRCRVLAGEELPDFFAPTFWAGVNRALEDRHGSHLAPLLNATGVVLHTNLGRAPLAPEALAALAGVGGGYSNLEYDLDQGRRGSRHDHLVRRLKRLTGAEDALAVNNCAAAVLLVLGTLARDGEVLVSRGELIEIGGSFRMPDVIAQSGARLVEVGATNKTRLSDYERAIGPDTRLILKSHTSNYRVTGFTRVPGRRELAELARRHGLPLVEDLGSGTLVDLAPFGLPAEPTVQQCVAAGTDLVTFSGDKLLGGPQAGIILGRAELIARLKKNPLLRALRIDKLCLAALEATLALYERPDPPQNHVPVLAMLAEDRAALTRRARRLKRGLEAIEGLRVWLADGVSLPGGGSLPGCELPTRLVQVEAAGLSPDRLARRLLEQRPALVGRIHDGAYTLDPRTLRSADLAGVVAAFRGAMP